MYKINLKNKVSFECDENTTIFDGAKSNGVVLEHSCLKARCRSCLARVLKGSTINLEDELVLTEEERAENFVLSCNAKPTSDLFLDIEHLGDVIIYDKKLVPSKISKIEFINDTVIKLELRLPPNNDFPYNAGQYLNIIHAGIKRSYSIANRYEKGQNLLFFIKNYENGLMSEYWFKKAKLNDLLRIEGPIGTFFFRDSSKENIIFLATGTGIAPVKAILEDLEATAPDKLKNKKVWFFSGARYENDLFWIPKTSSFSINYFPVLSRPDSNWGGNVGYVQDVVLRQNINLKNSQVYACGSNDMIEAAKKMFIENDLEEHDFYSDAFVQTN